MVIVARIINNITFIIIIIATDQDLCQNFKCVTIFFGNIVGFDSLAADCNPDEVDTDDSNDYDGGNGDNDGGF